MTVNTVSSVGSSAGVGGMQRPPEPPKEITKSGLEEMKKQIEESGGQVPEGLDKLIENFDEAAGDDGKMTFKEFKAYAAENGVTIQDPPKGGAAGGKPPAGGPPPAGAAGSARSGSSTSSSTSSSDGVSNMSDAELMALAAKGNAQAIQELAKRQAAKLDNGDIGQNVDTFA
jgi:hypothetical protein